MAIRSARLPSMAGSYDVVARRWASKNETVYIWVTVIRVGWDLAAKWQSVQPFGASCEEVQDVRWCKL